MFFPFQFPAWLLASPSTLRSPYCRPLAGVIHTLAYQSLPTSIPCGEAIARRRTEDRRVGLASGGTVERWRRFSSRGSCTRWRRIMISSRKPRRSMYITSTPPPGQSWGGRGGTWHARPPGRGAGGRRSNCLRSLTGLHRSPPPEQFVADLPLERDGFETSVPGERAYGLNLCLSPYELPFSGAQLLGLEGAHQMKWLALAGLPRGLAESGPDPVAVPLGNIEQKLRGDNQRGYVGRDHPKLVVDKSAATAVHSYTCLDP